MTARCELCARHYGDDGVCDRGMPVASPHRAPGKAYTYGEGRGREQDVELAHAAAMRENRVRWQSRDRIVDIESAHEVALEWEHRRECVESDGGDFDPRERTGFMQDWEPFCEYCGDLGCAHCAEDSAALYGGGK